MSHVIAAFHQRITRQSENQLSNCIGFRCRNGECIDNDQVCNDMDDCPDRSDEIGCNENSKQPKCVALVSIDQNFNCKYFDKEIPCYQSLPGKTKAQIDCNLKNSYFEANSLFYNFCRPNGRWVDQVPDCKIECGKISNNALQQATSLPWAAFIVTAFPEGNYITCSATIVSPFVVITNARCVLPSVDKTMYRILVGKGFSPSAEQYHLVEEIHIHTRYNVTSIQYELALFETKSKIVFNDFVTPACIDEQMLISFRANQVSGSMVTITGGNPLAAGADILVTKEIQHKNYEDCRKMVQKPNAISSQDMCGVHNGNNGPADSEILGAGLTFELNGVNYLYGVGRWHQPNTNSDIYIYSDMSFEFNILFLRNKLIALREMKQRMCKSIFSTTALSSICEQDGRSFPCDRSVTPGTIARIKCNEGYKFKDSTSLAIYNFCQENGQWSERVLDCVPECGILNTANNDRSSGVSQPWKANLFDKRTDTAYWVICEGTLVSPYAILSAARCAYGNDAPIRKRAVDKLKAAVGHKSLLLPDKRDVNARYVDVEDVIIHPQYNTNNLDTSDYNIAIFDLRVSFVLSRFILPICIDRSLALRSGSSTGTVLGWDIDRVKNAANTQVPTPILYLNYDNCRRLVPSNDSLFNTMFCGIDMSDERMKIPLSRFYVRGAGATFVINNRHYLFGVSPHKYFTDRNGGREVFKLTDAQSPSIASFVNDTITRISTKHSIPRSKCLIEQVPGTKYSRNECFNYDSCDEIPAGEYVDTFSVVHISCADKFAPPTDNDISYTFTTCNRGLWQPKNIKCTRLCEPLSSETVWVECYRGKRKVDCSRGSRPGDVALSTCSQGYVSNNNNDNENICRDDGTWSKPPLKCDTNCGIIRNEVGFISGGEEAKSNRHPWNVALYLKDKNDVFKQICGGTIIGARIVLSAAHCFHSPGKWDNKFPINSLSVGIDKQFRTYKDPRDVRAQYYEVAEVIVPEIYKGGTNTGFVMDLALVKLKAIIQFINNVIPACIDLTRKYENRLKNSVGTVVGWGLNASSANNGVSTDSLHLAKLPFYEFEDCRKYLDKTSDNSLSKDKFCAFSNTSSVQPGDSGAGMLFEFDNRQFVVGIVSSQLANTGAGIPVNTFTNLTGTTHLNFITFELQKRP